MTDLGGWEQVVRVEEGDHDEKVRGEPRGGGERIQGMPYGTRNHEGRVFPCSEAQGAVNR